MPRGKWAFFFVVWPRLQERSATSKDLHHHHHCLLAPQQTEEKEFVSNNRSPWVWKTTTHHNNNYIILHKWPWTSLLSFLSASSLEWCLVTLVGGGQVGHVTLRATHLWQAVLSVLLTVPVRTKGCICNPKNKTTETADNTWELRSQRPIESRSTSLVMMLHWGWPLTSHHHNLIRHTLNRQHKSIQTTPESAWHNTKRPHHRNLSFLYDTITKKEKKSLTNKPEIENELKLHPPPPAVQ